MRKTYGQDEDGNRVLNSRKPKKHKIIDRCKGLDMSNMSNEELATALENILSIVEVTAKFNNKHEKALKEAAERLRESEKLIKACKLLIDQYNEKDNYRLGGGLTNEPFLKIGKLIHKPIRNLKVPE